MLLNMDRGLLCHREILFWQEALLFGGCLSLTSSSYGLGRFFCNGKSFKVTHPILERDQKETKGDIGWASYKFLKN